MKKSKQDKLRASGWKLGTFREFLGLRDEEALLIEIKLALAAEVRKRRTRLGWTQERAARELGSSQSRVAKMEAADASVSIDLYVRTLLGLGAKRKDLAEAMRGSA